MPQALSLISEQTLSQIKGICFDIDDTFSTHGKITAQAFQALWNLYQAGYYLIPVTGRPAGWCDHIARFWPVHAIVGENGAFTFYSHQNKLNRLDTLATEESLNAKSKLKNLALAIQKEFPEAQFASDQNYREYDLAIDFCEDVPHWNQERVQELVQFCTQQGAIAKISSIHVNTWFGHYTKLQGFNKFLNFAKQNINSQWPNQPHEWIYMGDSPNDEPMFEAFPCSVGVANVAHFLDSMKNPPRWITKNPMGLGFAELAQLILRG